MKYKVRFYRDNLYEIVEFNPDEDMYESIGFISTLADCEAWIRLKEGGYM